MPLTDAEFQAKVAAEDEQWREKIAACYAEEGTDPFDLSELELVPVALQLDLKGATPQRAEDIEASAARAAQWLRGSS